MPEQKKLELGPMVQGYADRVTAMTRQRVEVEVAGVDQDAVLQAYATEYGTSGFVEQPYLRPALYQLKSEIKDLLLEGGPERVRERLEELVREYAERNVDDPKLAHEISTSVRGSVLG